MDTEERVITKAALECGDTSFQVVVDGSRRKKKSKNEEVSVKSNKDKHETDLKSQKNNEINIQSAKLEVIKFATSSYKAKEKRDAKEALAIKLGAKPQKNKYVNYKQLIENKKREKQEDDEADRLQTLGKMLKHSGRKNKNAQTLINKKKAHISTNESSNTPVKRFKKREKTNILEQYGKVTKAKANHHKGKKRKF